MDGFTFFKSYYESAQHLSDKDQAQFYKLIMDYMFTDREPQLQGHLMGFWLLIKPNLDTSKSRAKAGQTKSNPNQIKIKSKSNPNQTKSNTEPSPLEDKDKDKDKDIIIDTLNNTLGKKYKTTTKNKSLIASRLKEGFTVDDFKYVIKIKCAEWRNDDKMSKFLRPETLFGTKFEGYLNQKEEKIKKYNYHEDENEQVGGVTW